MTNIKSDGSLGLCEQGTVKQAGKYPCTIPSNNLDLGITTPIENAKTFPSHAPSPFYMQNTHVSILSYNAITITTPLPQYFLQLPHPPAPRRPPTGVIYI